jgi:hypothetical protein
MRLIKVTLLKTKQPVYINIEQIGDIYGEEEKIEYGRIETPKHTNIGVTTHNNGGFRVVETVDEVLKLIKNSKGI